MPLEILPGVRHDTRDYPFDAGLVAELWEMEDRHFWHAARHAWVLDALSFYGAPVGGTVLEVGCGSGAAARALAEAGYRVTGIDTVEPFVRKALERTPSGRFVAGRLEEMPPGSLDSYDVVAFLDVLEHLDDPLGLLTRALRSSRTGGLVLVTVPARRDLWSPTDELTGHKRRYEPGEASRLLEQAGARPLAEHGIFRWTVPLLRLRRRHRLPSSNEERRVLLRSELRVPPAPVNAALAMVSAAERRLGFERSRGLAGSTILAVGRVGDVRSATGGPVTGS